MKTEEPHAENIKDAQLFLTFIAFFAQTSNFMRVCRNSHHTHKDEKNVNDVELWYENLSVCGHPFLDTNNL